MVDLMQRTFTRVMSPLYERMFLVLTIVFCSSLAVMLLNVSRLQGHLIESMALVNGELYATVLSQPSRTPIGTVSRTFICSGI